DPADRALALQHRMRPVFAYIVKRPQHPLMVANDCDRVSGHLRRGIRARCTYLLCVAYPLPGLSKDLLFFNSEPGWVGVRLRPQRRRTRRVRVIARPDFPELKLRWHHGSCLQRAAQRASIALRTSADYTYDDNFSTGRAASSRSGRSVGTDPSRG